MNTRVDTIVPIAVCSIVAYKLLQPLVKIFYTYGLSRWIFCKKNQVLRAGDWAIVTGATSGIGRAFAIELAKSGLDIFLLSRSEEKLKDFADELEREYQVKTKYLAVDFTQVDIYAAIEREVSSLSSVACLVNNVGITNSELEELHSEPTLTYDCITRLVHCNILSAACMTRMVLPQLIKQNSGAAIINLGSATARIRAVYYTLYASTKAWMGHFSSCLHAEVAGHRVLIQNYSPMYIATEMFHKRPGFLTPSAQTFVRSALNMLGVKRDLCGYWPHEILVYATNLTWQPLMTATIRWNLLRLKRKSN